jgi:hypothetical protein
LSPVARWSSGVPVVRRAQLLRDCASRGASPVARALGPGSWGLDQRQSVFPGKLFFLPAGLVRGLLPACECPWTALTAPVLPIERNPPLIRLIWYLKRGTCRGLGLSSGGTGALGAFFPPRPLVFRIRPPHIPCEFFLEAMLHFRVRRRENIFRKIHLYGGGGGSVPILTHGHTKSAHISHISMQGNPGPLGASGHAASQGHRGQPRAASQPASRGAGVDGGQVGPAYPAPDRCRVTRRRPTLHPHLPGAMLPQPATGPADPGEAFHGLEPASGITVELFPSRESACGPRGRGKRPRGRTCSEGVRAVRRSRDREVAAGRAQQPSACHSRPVPSKAGLPCRAGTQHPPSPIPRPGERL